MVNTEDFERYLVERLKVLSVYLYCRVEELRGKVCTVGPGDCEPVRMKGELLKEFFVL